MVEFWWLIAVAAVVVCLGLFRLLSPGQMGQALEKARRTGEVAGVVAIVEAAPEKKHPNLWDQSIGTLWQEYHRPAAIALIVAAARRSDAPVIQFWIKKALEVEPEIAVEIFTPEFLEEFFRPEVAARCGRVGCCG